MLKRLFASRGNSAGSLSREWPRLQRPDVLVTHSLNGAYRLSSVLRRGQGHSRLKNERRGRSDALGRSRLIFKHWVLARITVCGVIGFSEPPYVTSTLPQNGH